MLTKYGYSTLGIIAIIVFILLSLNFFVQNNALRLLLIILPLLFLIFALNFFRDPERIPPPADNVIVSPADGKVIVIKDVVDSKIFKEKARQISIFMSPLNVHVNRVPIDGIVEHVRYYNGKFIAAFEDKASTENERAEFIITSKYGKVFFTQVAGLIARRIIYELKPGEKVKKGERFGMIKFGSRVDVVVPYSWIIKVNKNDAVTAGETILFEHPGK